MKKPKILFLNLFLISIVLMACGGRGGEAPAATEAAATEAPTANDGIIPNTGGSETSAGIEHKVVPGELPEQTTNHAGDQDSSTMADKNRATGGDRFTFGRFERPFNANTMDVYFGNIDIQDFTVFVDDNFVYSSVIFKSIDAGTSTPARYAMEFDMDFDGRGDVLVLALQPAGMDWTTDGVQVWSDGNEDVGGEAVMKTDGVPPGDGFETKIFDQGQGNDPDTAWVRLSPEDPNTIQIAVKLSLFDGDDKYLVGYWAGNQSLDPALFDLNDHFTHEQAGAAMVDFEIYYPIKALAEVDNTCRLNVGFTPNGTEPGMCSIPGVIVEGGGGSPSCSVTCGSCQILNPVTCSCESDPQC